MNYDAEQEQFAGISIFNPVRRITGYNGMPRYISSINAPRNVLGSVTKHRGTPLITNLFGEIIDETWVNEKGLIEKYVAYDSQWDDQHRKKVNVERYRYEAFFNDYYQCVHCEVHNRLLIGNIETMFHYDLEYDFNEWELQKKSIVCTDVRRNRKSRYTYYYDDNCDLHGLAIDDISSRMIFFTYDENHHLLTKEEHMKNVQLNLFEGEYRLGRSTYYKYDSQGRLVSIEENEDGNNSIIKQIAYYNDGSSRTIEKGCFGEIIYTRIYAGCGCPSRRIKIKRNSLSITNVSQTDMTKDEHGNPIFIKCIRIEYLFDKKKNKCSKNKIEWEKSFVYVYDRNENWIQKEEFVDGKIRSVIQRVIEYW
ncbi:MAG: hypothetical protein J6Y52_05535 [Bacteroidales bacterium]|nr:hypothetical protein [Bacteroidales bacterium]